MQLRTEIQLISMIKSMTDVVMPAIDGSNMLAQEQAQLVVGMLNLMSQQGPAQFSFDRDELQRLLASAKELQNISLQDSSMDAPMAALQSSSESAASALSQCQFDPAILLEQIQELRADMSQIVVSLAETDELEAQLQAERIVLQMSGEQLLRDRSLMLPQGWEQDTSAVPPLETLLKPRS